MRRVSGRLGEVVAYENRPTGGLLREEVPGHLIFLGKKLFRAVDDMCSSMFSLKFLSIFRVVKYKRANVKIGP